jgi:ribonuclease P protein component
MALWPGTAPGTGARFSSAEFSRAGGGSLSERPVPGAQRETGLGLRRELRLRHRTDFDAVFRKGHVWNSGLLVLRTLPNGLDHNRHGFVTSKRLGGAVVRNRVRRRLREVVRALPLRPGWDIVFSAKVPAAAATFQELKRAVVGLLGRAAIQPAEMPPETSST